MKTLFYAYWASTNNVYARTNDKVWALGYKKLIKWMRIGSTCMRLPSVLSKSGISWRERPLSTWVAIGICKNDGTNWYWYIFSIKMWNSSHDAESYCITKRHEQWSISCISDLTLELVKELEVVSPLWNNSEFVGVWAQKSSGLVASNCTTIQFSRLKITSYRD